MKKNILYLMGGLIVLLLCVILLLHRDNKVNAKRTIYAVLPLSGAAAELGNNIKDALDMYLRENKESIIAIKYIDSESLPSKAISGINQALIGVKNPIVITAVASISNALIPVVNDHNGFCINLCTVSITKENKANFNSYQRYSLGIVDAVKPLIEYINKKFSSICIIHSNDEYGVSYYSEFEGKIKGNVRGVSCTVTPQDMRDVATKAMSTNPDAILIAGTPTANYRNAVSELRRIGYKGSVLADMSFVNPFIYKNIADASEGVVTVCSDADIVGSHGPWGTDFVEKCKRNSVTPYFNTLQSYEAMYIIEKLLREGVVVTQKAFCNLEEVPFKDNVVFPGNGDVFFNFFLAKVSGGNLVKISEE